MGRGKRAHDRQDSRHHRALSALQRHRVRAAERRAAAAAERASLRRLRRETRYLDLLDQIGEEAMRRANRAIEDLKKNRRG